MSSLHRTTTAWNRPGRIATVVAFGLGLAGFVVFVARPVFPTPVEDVSQWLPRAVPERPWDRSYISSALVAGLRPALLVLLVVSGPGRRLLDRITGSVSASVVGATVAAVTVLVVIDLLLLPIAWWGRVTQQDAVGWIADRLLIRAQTWALVGVLAAGITFTIRRWPASWHWRSLVAIGALAMIIPLAADLDPFAGDLRPLPDGPVRDHIAAAAARAGASDVPLRVGSGTAATELGAYVSGIGPSRSIVLSEAVIDVFPPEQVAFVAMHEYAHREHLDVYRKVAGTIAGLVAGLWILRYVLSRGAVRRRIETSDSAEAHRMIVALAVVAVVYAAAAPVSNLASRRSEAAADWRALEVTADPDSAIAIQQLLVARGGVDPTPPDWYQAWLATHPSPADRIGLALRYARLHGIELTP